MRALDHRYWPIWVAIVFLILAAGIDATTQSLPLWLTLSALLASWAAGWCVTREQLPSAGGGLVPALLLSALGLAILLPLYALGTLTVGSVLAGTVLGGWIGCAVSADRGAKWLAACAVAGRGRRDEPASAGRRAADRSDAAGGAAVIVGFRSTLGSCLCGATPIHIPRL